MRFIKKMCTGIAASLVLLTNTNAAFSIDTVDTAANLEQRKKIDQLTLQVKSEPNRALLYAARCEWYVRLKDWDNALKDINTALSLDSNTALFFAARAGIYHSMKRYDLDKLDSERAVKLAPNDVQCLKRLALCYGAFKDYSKSIPVFTKALLLEPENTNVRLLRAEDFISVHELVRASEDVETVLKLEPGNKKAMIVKEEIENARPQLPVTR